MNSDLFLFFYFRENFNFAILKISNRYNKVLIACNMKFIFCLLLDYACN